jgi:nudix-type nucleoside diphosphatase (YffH/AdpP family)
MADQILSTRPIFSGWFNVLMLKLRLAGEECERPVVEHPSGAAVLVYDPDRRVALTVRETRLAVLHLNEERLAEPVGGVAEDESRADTARREAMEEVGVKLGQLEPVGRVWMTPASTTERVDLFLAEYSERDRVSRGGGAEGEIEQIDVREESLMSLWASTERGAMTDAKMLLLLQALRIRKPELFTGPLV